MVLLVEHQVLLLQEVEIPQSHQVLLEEYQLLVITHTLVQQMQELQVEPLGDQHQTLIHKDHLQLTQTYHHTMLFVTL